MAQVVDRIGPVVGGGVALLVALVVGGCSAPAPADTPPAPPSPPVTTLAPAAPVPTVAPTTSDAPAPLPVVTPKDGTNTKACADGTCEVAIDGPRTFRVLSFTAKATPGPGSVSVEVGNDDMSASTNGPVTTPGSLGGLGSNGENVDYALTGQDARGRPVLTFTRG